jgi:serine/threonine protein kinase
MDIMASEEQDSTSNGRIVTFPLTNGQKPVYNGVHHAKETWEEDIDTPSSNSDIEEEEENLKDKLLLSMQESQFEKTPNSYIPRDKVDEIFGTQSKRDGTPNLLIFEPMGVSPATPTENDLSLAYHVRAHCRILYLIAVFIELEPKSLRELMSIFRQDEFTDQQLPISVWTMEELKTDTKKHPLVLMERKYSEQKPRIWNFRHIQRFQSDQWKFLIPTISTTEIFHDFRQFTIPFIAKHNFRGKGGNGIVYKYEIHHAHFNDPSSPIITNEALAQNATRNVVAVKEIRKEGNKVAKRWEKEVRALARMNEFDHAHIVRFITSFVRRGTSDEIEHYVMFEWADGGNLSDFRAAYPYPELTIVLIKWVIQQLYGLAQALSKAHYLDEEGSYRHGDLKPANILWFKQGETEFGTLKIGDWGEAKEHYNGTAFRHDTTAQYGTRRYEPPEVSTGLNLKLSRNSKFARSRLYDIWGIGCITLEFLIWLMYGLDELKEFNKQNIGDYGVSDMFYEVSLGKPAKVHAVVQRCMNHMAKDPRCFSKTTALGDLLQIVRTRLLVVKLPPEGGAKKSHLHPHDVLESPISATVFQAPTNMTEIFDTKRGNDISIKITPEIPDPTLASPGEPKRCLATEFETQLQKILENEQDDSYWYKVYTSTPAPVEYRRSNLLSVASGPIVSTRDLSGLRYGGSAQEDYGMNNSDLETWIFENDNEFAERLFSRLRDARVMPRRAALPRHTLCSKCMAVRKDIWIPFFKQTYEVATLERNSTESICDLCCLLWHTYQKFCTTKSSDVKFQRNLGMIMMDGIKSPVLTLLQNNSKKQFIESILISKKANHSYTEPRSQASPDVQIGFADLLEPGQDVHIEVLRAWLEDCDRDHECKPYKSLTTRVPTRLIDVGTNGGDMVQLRETDPSRSYDWVALSYRWGPTPHFSTTTENREVHLAGMSMDRLPQTFRDAIAVTRSLKKQYLWIDSICIIQGKGGDFSKESKRMEDVYSGAYCVLAASCATDQRSGFLLRQKKAREYVAFDADNDADHVLYVCERIENFKEHVLDGELCQRGWVLQEHALARRTIFFTEHQTYWECGKGIRCESLAKMRK